ncbi:MAG: hypothetical protein VB078_07110 [Clostridiaceae bacterium]|nr:hypothetical protein [Clostridiaceae bacterium]
MKKCDVARRKKCRLYKLLTIGAGVTMGITLSFFVVMIRGVRSCIETLDTLRDNSKE